MTGAPFWDWALAAYARPGAAQALLALQDKQGQSVSYLLWAAWAATEHRALAPDVLAAGAALAQRWEATAIAPLRAVRRALKPAFYGIADPPREALRAAVKALELDAERALMTALEGLAPPASAPPAALDEALLAAGRAWPSPPPDAALRALAQTLA